MSILNQGLKYQTGIEILENANLNNYTIPGNYYCRTNAFSATISNRPTDINIAFTLEVIKHLANTQQGVVQRLVPFSSPNSIYQRSYTYTNVWSNWQRFTPIRVKGNAESTYRTGDVNLTPANIGTVPFYESVSNPAQTIDRELGLIINTPQGTRPTITFREGTSFASYLFQKDGKLRWGGWSAGNTEYTVLVGTRSGTTLTIFM